MRTRVSDERVEEIISNEGELATGPVSALGVLRLALDLHDARGRIGQLEEQCQANQIKEVAELSAIRARDATWRDLHPIKDTPGRDRRWLLRYIGEVGKLVDDIASEVRELRSRMQANLPRVEQHEVEAKSQAPCANQEKKEA